MDVLPLNAAGIRRAAEVLRRGGVAAVPTESSYALAADARDRTAVSRIRRLKGRGPKPIALMAASPAMVRRFFRVDSAAARLMRRHWPGALTIVLPVRDRGLRRAGLAADGAVGVRVPASAPARRLSAAVGAPLVATSANVSRRPPCFSRRAFLAQFSGRALPDLFLDAGALPRRRPSTVVRLVGERLHVLRQGPVRP